MPHGVNTVHMDFKVGEMLFFLYPVMRNVLKGREKKQWKGNSEKAF